MELVISTFMGILIEVNLGTASITDLGFYKRRMVFIIVGESKTEGHQDGD